MARAARMLERFPSFYRRGGSTLLDEVVAALAAPLDEVDVQLLRVQRAHRIQVAEDVRDVVRLAALLGLTRAHFADLLDATALPYEVRLARVKARARRVALLHHEGLGTPWAVLEGAALLLGLEVVRDPATGARLRPADADGLAWRVDGRFPDAPPDERASLVLYESPRRRRSLAPAPRGHGEPWAIESADAEPAPVRVTITGIGERTVVPRVACLSTGESLRFHGVVPDGATLVVAADGATLDGVPVDHLVSWERGATLDRAGFDDAAATLVVERDGPSATWWDGQPGTLATPAVRRVHPLPVTPAGRGEWELRVAEGRWDAATLDFAVYALPEVPRGRWDEDPGFDRAAFHYDDNAVVGLGWEERVACTFKLVLPTHVPSPGEDGVPAWARTDVGRVGELLARFRPAGVRAVVDIAADAWVLGEGVVRDAAATDGPGIEHHTTRLLDEDAERLVADTAIPAPRGDA